MGMRVFREPFINEILGGNTLTRLRKPERDEIDETTGLKVHKPAEKGYSELRYGRTKVISDLELQDMLNAADKIKEQFYRLRAKAVIALFRLSGKRRGELAMLELNDFTIEKNLLNVLFHLEKKRKNSPPKKRIAIKSFLLSDPLTAYVLEYVDHLKTLTPVPKYFLPRTVSVFGTSFVIMENEHLTGRQVLRIIRQVSEASWCHLFRETKGADCIKLDPTVTGAFLVQDTLDLERIETGYAYMKRYAHSIIKRPEQK